MDVLSELEDIARRNNLPSIGPIKGEIIQKIINKYKPRTILEIGALHGYSAILMTSLVLKEGININNILVTIEIDHNLIPIINQNIEKARLSDKITVLHGDALNIIPKLDNNNKFDLLFLDAEKDQYIKYLKLVENKNLLSENAVVVADNVIIYEKEMNDYLEYVRNSGNYKSYTTETSLEFTKNIKDALEISVKKSI